MERCTWKLAVNEWAEAKKYTENGDSIAHTAEWLE